MAFMNSSLLMVPFLLISNNLNIFRATSRSVSFILPISTAPVLTPCTMLTNRTRYSGNICDPLDICWDVISICWDVISMCFDPLEIIVIWGDGSFKLSSGHVSTRNKKALFSLARFMTIVLVDECTTKDTCCYMEKTLERKTHGLRAR